MRHTVVPDKKWSRLLFRIIVCTIIVLMPVIDAPTPNPTSFLMLDNPFVIIDMFLHFLCLVFSYFNYFFIIPAFFHRNKIVYFAIVIAIFILLSFVPLALSKMSLLPYFPQEDVLRIHTTIQTRHLFFLFTITVFFGILTTAEVRRRIAEQERSLSELRFLKAQINPHFLFNTLNSIYAQIQLNPAAAGRSLIKMCNIMRYILHATENNLEKLNQAVEYLDDYTELQKERFGETIEIEYVNRVEQNDFYIMPLLLIPFVENAFKYGVNPLVVAKIKILITTEKNVLKLIVVNQDFSKENQSVHSTGIGLENTIKRLENSYPDKHKLTIDRDNGLFAINLEILLT